MKLKSKINRWFYLMAVAFLLLGCDNEKHTEAISQDVFAMDTYMTVSAYGKNAKKAVEAACNRILELDGKLSIGKADSEIAKLNTEKNVQVSKETCDLIKEAVFLSKETGMAFDPTILPLMELWGFTTQNYRVPEESEIKEALACVDVSSVTMDETDHQVSLGSQGQRIDLGGIAKGYTSSEVMKIFKEQGVQNGIVSLGGNVQALGTKPDGSLWRVAIQHPLKEQEYLGVVNVADKAVITSGGYERYFEQDGRIYHHILDPSTGYPSASNLISVTIVSADGTLADGLSTALFVMGYDKAADYWHNHRDQFDMILFTQDGDLYVTEGLRDNFSSELTFTIIDESVKSR